MAAIRISGMFMDARRSTSPSIMQAAQPLQPLAAVAADAEVSVVEVEADAAAPERLALQCLGSPHPMPVKVVKAVRLPVVEAAVVVVVAAAVAPAAVT